MQRYSLFWESKLSKSTRTVLVHCINLSLLLSVEIDLFDFILVVNPHYSSYDFAHFWSPNCDLLTLEVEAFVRMVRSDVVELSFLLLDNHFYPY